MWTANIAKIIVLTCLVSSVYGQKDKKSGATPPDMSMVKLVGTTAHKPINEMSGLVKSRTYPDVYWVNNDSGDIPRIFAVNKNGNVIMPAYMKNDFYADIKEEGKKPFAGIEILLAANQDWEDIAVDDDLIYIADLGNNANARRDMGVYMLYEPNPRATVASRVLQYIPIRYPEQIEYPARQWHFDSESMFVADGNLYFLSKHRQPGELAKWEGGVNLYRLDSYDTLKANVLTKVDSFADLSVATGADVSPNGKHLAVVTYSALWVFEKTGDDQWLSGKASELPLDYNVTKQAEAVCWDDDETILISNEQREIFEIKLVDIPGATVHK